MTVSSLWWWDGLVTLDRARASEAKLAATQERLRLATDVHDLQEHHLQVIALQLELAERLMPRAPEAGMEQLRAARASVDDARQGTRDLATRFRAAPLSDELANTVACCAPRGPRRRSPCRRKGCRMIRVLLADDEGMIRSALAALLRLEPDIDVVERKRFVASFSALGSARHDDRRVCTPRYRR
ncbi:histidine kinase [Nonomuraea terrae]|uniref:histidine kinase n=1 Tax=Nonomuraea terrae TaxID=2530383 RepID=UPI0037A68C6D